MKPRLALIALTFPFLIPSSLSAPTPAPFPYACEDLGVECRADPLARKEVAQSLALLRRTDPEKYLPPELAAHVRQCSRMRRSGNPQAAAFCGFFAPLRGKLRDITFIPKSQLRAARLPPSGARVVVDCLRPGEADDGLSQRHLQVSDDLSPDDLFAALKDAFDALLSEKLARQLPAVTRADDAMGSIAYCAVGENIPSPVVQTVEWKRPYKGYDFSGWDKNPPPPGYFRAACEPGVKREPRPRPPVHRNLDGIYQALREGNQIDFEKHKLGCALSPPDKDDPEGCPALRKRGEANSKRLEELKDAAPRALPYIYEDIEARFPLDDPMKLILGFVTAVEGDKRPDAVQLMEKAVNRLEDVCGADPCSCFAASSIDVPGWKAGSSQELIVHQIRGALPFALAVLPRALEFCEELRDKGGYDCSDVSSAAELQCEPMKFFNFGN